MPNGAHKIVRAFSELGVEVCFANPGTSEVHLVRALDEVRRVRACLTLHENVATGAADGYARMAGFPAMALLHLLPGLANGLSNLHNAKRAASPVVTVVGQHSSWHVAFDSPITGNIPSLASCVSGWVREARRPECAAQDARDAVHAALDPPGCVATLIVPVDVQSSEAGENDVARLRPAKRRTERVDVDMVECLASLLRQGRQTALYLGGSALSEAGLWLAAQIAAATSCTVFSASHPARAERGGGLPWFASIPYFPEQAASALEGITALVGVGASRPVYMFGAVDGSSSPVPQGCTVIGTGTADAYHVLQAIADCLGVQDARLPVPHVNVDFPRDLLNGRSTGGTVARMLPADAIVVDESGTSCTGYLEFASLARRHTRLGVTGGSIGMGLPVAVGAAVACPGQRVLALQADGGGMYTPQSLWTMARESLDVTVVLLSNRRYAILDVEYARAGFRDVGPLATSLVDLSQPELDWVKLAEAQGVPGTRVSTVPQFEMALARSLTTSGPMLIDVPL